jgi:hypothetical protein
VLVREPGTYIYYDLEKEDASQIRYWINKMSLKKIGEPINREVVAIAKEVDHPFVYLYMNRQDPKYGVDSKVAFDAL